MNGIHDLGGMHGFGPVVAQSNEPVFHEEWERCIFALTMAMLPWRIGNIRTAWEQMPPADYLATSYYEHWLFALELKLEQSGLLGQDELKRLRGTPESLVASSHLPASIRHGAMHREEARAGPVSRWPARGSGDAALRARASRAHPEPPSGWSHASAARA